MKPIIRVENVSKQYRIGAIRPPYQTLREALSQAIRLPFRRPQNRPQARNGKIWALKDISFTIEPGEVVGIIGRNGAGKSTLLKILSRVTEPTIGRVQLYGRIGSLLEVGTGFHPELTGRENVFLNGAILGMTRIEIQRKFEEIVAFSEIEKFIDTPVKWYSTGMYLRLAFAVAAHFEPEILIIDEVLAVGDANFQEKCLNKMNDLRRGGRTILFVSHNMAAVSRLCKRVISLSEGMIVSDGPTAVDESKKPADSKVATVGSNNLAPRVKITSEKCWDTIDETPGDDTVRLRAVRTRTEDGKIVDSVDIRRPVGIEMEFDVLESGHILVPNYHFRDENGVDVFSANDHDPVWRRQPRPAGHYVSTAWIPGNFLSEGILRVSAAVSTMVPVKVHVYEIDVCSFRVFDTQDGDSARGDYVGPLPGFVRPLLAWTTDFQPSAETSPDSLVTESLS
jgi:lipopolysaccharide transport system ATP-binding protein